MNGYMWDYKRRNKGMLPENVVPPVCLGEKPRKRTARPRHDRPMNGGYPPAKNPKTSYASGKSKGSNDLEVFSDEEEDDDDIADEGIADEGIATDTATAGGAVSERGRLWVCGWTLRVSVSVLTVG
jgi:hypothetical protein